MIVQHAHSAGYYVVFSVVDSTAYLGHQPPSGNYLPLLNGDMIRPAEK